MSGKARHCAIHSIIIRHTKNYLQNSIWTQKKGFKRQMGACTLRFCFSSPYRYPHKVDMTSISRIWKTKILTQRSIITVHSSLVNYVHFLKNLLLFVPGKILSLGTFFLLWKHKFCAPSEELDRNYWSVSLATEAQGPSMALPSTTASHCLNTYLTFPRLYLTGKLNLPW